MTKLLLLHLTLCLTLLTSCDDTAHSAKDLFDQDGPGQDGSGVDRSHDTQDITDSPGDDQDQTLDGRDSLLPDTDQHDGLSGSYRFGINGGHPNASWSDAQTFGLAAAAGCDSNRPKLPEYHLERWGYEIEVGDMQSYASDGLHDLAAFVIGPTREHSTIPNDEPDWKRDYYIPANLHTPIWLPDGQVNPDNYWAAYLYQTMSIYGEWVLYWEIWNEPDWVADWQVTQSWTESPPLAADLPRFNGDIFDYVRMLRIAWEVKEKVAPHTLIAVGGLGYPSFLDAIVRYSDQPGSGATDADHPYTGAHYFEVVSFHHYPHLAGQGSSARALLQHKAEMQAVLDKHQVAAKRWIVTESGASAHAFAELASGPDFARDYLWKMAALAQWDGIEAIHWFILSQGADPESPFSHMGLYQDLSSLADPSEALLTDTGVAHQSLTQLVAGARVDLQATAEIQAQAGVDGVAYQLANGDRAYMLWALESSATASLSSQTPLYVHQWDFSQTQSRQELSPNAGLVELSLSEHPVIIAP